RSVTPWRSIAPPSPRSIRSAWWRRDCTGAATALPCRSMERAFAAPSTGFGSPARARRRWRWRERSPASRRRRGGWGSRRRRGVPHRGRVGRIRILYGEHPIPGAGSFAATRALEAELRARPANETVLLLLSGGASALLAAPAPGISPRDKAALNRLLVGAGF